AYLLFMAWENDHAPKPAPTPAATASQAVPTSADGSVPAAMAVASSAAPSSTAATVATHEPSAPASAQLITVDTDVLHLTIDTRGGSLVHAELLAYPQQAPTHKNPTPPPVVLLDNSPTHYFVAQNGLVSSSDTAPADQPNHLALFHSEKTSYTLAPWQGNAYQQLQRIAPPKPSSWFSHYTDPEQRSFIGAAWYTGEKFEKLGFKDFGEKKDALDSEIKGGWAAMLRLYFVTAWIPPASQTNHYVTQTIDPDSAHPRYLIRTMSPTLNVAAGQSLTTEARLYVGPNRQGTLDAIAPGLDLTIDYGMFKAIAVPMHWLLSQFHAITKNWGVAIILLVLLIKGLTWKLTAMQYRSSARMRKLTPRLQALKERYGDDRQKMQQATMELYKKEKVNPMGGCLPVLITLPVFYGLFFVLEYSLELRHAPFLWIPDLSAPDPWYILPIIYAIVMLGTQWLNPVAAGMDPTQAKMMKVMPLLFTVMFAFLPAGLCLYYPVNGLVGLGQQWWVTHHIDREGEAKAKAA